MSTEQEVSAKIAQIDSFGNQEERIKGYKELTANVLDAKKFPLFKNIVDHRKDKKLYLLLMLSVERRSAHNCQQTCIAMVRQREAQ
jgi:hypothetical protein